MPNRFSNQKIFSICGARRLGHFNRSQFFIALKLVALAQNSYELNLENLGKANLPLPRRLSSSFSLFSECDAAKPKYDLNNVPPLNSLDSFAPSGQPHTLTHSPAGIILPPPPSSASKSKSSRLKNKRSPSQATSQICKFCSRSLINADHEQVDHLRSFVLICSNCKQSNGGLDSPPPPPPPAPENAAKNFSDLNSSSDNSRCSSTELYETIDNSLAFEKLKTWEKIESNQARDVGVDSADESKHCLLNDDDDTVDGGKIGLDTAGYQPDACCSAAAQETAKYEASANYDSNSFAINQIEEENDEDVWSMNDEQVRFYFEKFCRLLPTRGDRMLAGQSVKSFFEKSKLSQNDLMKIWSLADLDSDGHLTLIEFCIAFHLVVMRRNEVPLPEELPQSLSPGRIRLLLANNKLALTTVSPESATFKGRRDSFARESYGSITDSSSGSLPSYQHVSINVSNDNIASNVSSTAAVCSLLSQPRNSFDSDYSNVHSNVHSKSVVVDHHASQSSNPVHLRNQQADTCSSSLLSAGTLSGNLSANLSGGNLNLSGNLSGSMSSASIGEHDATITLYSPNREWTKFGNSPFTASRQQAGNATTAGNDHHQTNSNQTNPLAAGSNDANCLMAPANFDKIELDPMIPHPMPVKVSAGNSSAATLVNKDRVTSLK